MFSARMKKEVRQGGDEPRKVPLGCSLDRFTFVHGLCPSVAKGRAADRDLGNNPFPENGPNELQHCKTSLTPVGHMRYLVPTQALATRRAIREPATVTHTNTTNIRIDALWVPPHTVGPVYPGYYCSARVKL